VKTGTGMPEEGHLSFYFLKYKMSFLRKQESIPEKVFYINLFDVFMLEIAKQR